VKHLRVSPRPQERLLDEIFRTLPIAVTQAKCVCEECVTVLGMQRTYQLVVVGHARLSTTTSFADNFQ
jgi:hypothetical protein